MVVIFIPLGLLFAVTPAAGADLAAPVIAKVRRTITHSPAEGPETSIKVKEGVFYRSSKGLTYQSFGEVRGVPPFQIGHLTDHVAGKSFVVQLDRRRVVLRGRFCPGWPPEAVTNYRECGFEWPPRTSPCA